MYFAELPFCIRKRKSSQLQSLISFLMEAKQNFSKNLSKLLRWKLSPAIFSHFNLNFEKSLLHSVIPCSKKLIRFFRKHVFTFSTLILSIFRLKSIKLTFGDSSFSPLTLRIFWSCSHSKEDNLFYKDACWVVSLILTFINFQGIKLVRPVDIHYSFQQLLLFR